MTNNVRQIRRNKLIKNQYENKDEWYFLCAGPQGGGIYSENFWNKILFFSE